MVRVKQKFITNMILVYFRQVASKHGQSLGIHVLFNYYTMTVMERP